MKFQYGLKSWHKSTWVFSCFVFGLLVLIVLPGHQVSNWRSYPAWTQDDVDNGVFKHGWPFVFLTRVTPSKSSPWEAEEYLKGNADRKPEKTFEWAPSEYDENVVGSWKETNYLPLWLSLRNWRMFDGIDVRWKWAGLLIDLLVVGILVWLAALLFEWRRRKRQHLFQVSLFEGVVGVGLISIVLGFVVSNHRQFEKEQELANRFQMHQIENICPWALQPTWLERLCGFHSTQLTERVSHIGIGNAFRKDPVEANSREGPEWVNFDEIGIDQVNAMTSEFRWLRSAHISHHEIEEFECVQRIQHLELEFEFDRLQVLHRFPNIDSVRITYGWRQTPTFGKTTNYLERLLENPNLRKIEFYGIRPFESGDVEILIESRLDSITFETCQFDRKSLELLETLSKRKSVECEYCYLKPDDMFRTISITLVDGKIRIDEEK